LGTSWPDESAAVQVVVFTDAPENAANASAGTTAVASNITSFFM
jgi:hypothetical protein